MRTSRREFAPAESNRRVVPFARCVLADDDTALSAYRKLTVGQPAGSFLIERPGDQTSSSRWSHIGVRCPAMLIGTSVAAEWKGERPGPLPATGPAVSVLRQTLRLLHADAPPTVPLAGGMIGYVGHGLGALPDTFLLLTTDVAVYDRTRGTITLVANALVSDDRDPDTACADAMARLDDMSARLAVATPADATLGLPVPRSTQRQATTADALNIYRALRAMSPGRHIHLLRAADFDVVGGSPRKGAHGRHGGAVGYFGFNGDISTGASNGVLIRNGEAHVPAGPDADLLYAAIAAAETLDTPTSAMSRSPQTPPV